MHGINDSKIYQCVDESANSLKFLLILETCILFLTVHAESLHKFSAKVCV